ncbi:MAG: ribosomal-processing cysteine protease Prp [Lachnospiraceae bacterium]|nr:ribosomal-processing cysteine protease Prp [Lachnospiraceae bacterium]
MIKVTFFEDSSGYISKMKFEGHAGYADSGYDIVCSAVSMLFTNTLNSIEKFTDCSFKMDEGKNNSFVVTFLEHYADDCKLLLDSLKLGLYSVIDQYGNDYLKITLKEV